MSIFATNYIVDENTGEQKLVKHLNKTRVDRVSAANKTGKWNKNGSKARENKKWNKEIKISRRLRRELIRLNY